MSHFQSVICELEAALQSGTPGRRTEVLRQVTTLFASGGENISEDHISLFDDVMGHLIVCIETKALAELSQRLAPARNAPPGVVRKLASNDSIEVAGPILERSERLTDDDLIEIANTKGRAHQFKIAARGSLNEAVTNVLVDQCDPELANRMVANKGARISKAGFARLAMMAEGDDRLTTAIASRSDIPPYLFRAILARATDVVREALINSDIRQSNNELTKILNDISHQIDQKATSDHYAAAQQLVNSFSQDTQATKFKLLEFARDRKFAETAATLAALSAVPIQLVDRLMNDANRYGIMVLCKLMGLHWPVVRNVLLTCREPEAMLQSDVDELYDDYNGLSTSVAHRLLRFWQNQQLH